MVKIKITENEHNQRLDRFLKKYLKNAPLSYIYKAIRKDVKLNGRRAGAETMLAVGDEIAIYISDVEASSLVTQRPAIKARKQFRVAYEDDNLLIAEKPSGLLTHGDRDEKKNTLANQVIGYLIAEGSYTPGRGTTFVPSPVNRLDRNTSGLVIFGKNYGALQALNHMIRQRGFVSKYYITIVHGEVSKALLLQDMMRKDRGNNTIEVLASDAAPPGAHDDSSDNSQKFMETAVRPLIAANGYSLMEVELITGRTHQIRAHLAKAGHPVIGDPKYGDPAVNVDIEKRFGLTTQFLHAHKLVFTRAEGELAYLKGIVVEAPLQPRLEGIRAAIFDGSARH